MRMLHYGAVYFIQPLMLTAMATMPTRTANVGLYRKLLRAAQTFESYNTRDYAVRYVRHVRPTASVGVMLLLSVCGAEPLGRRNVGKRRGGSPRERLEPLCATLPTA